jgi:hypothetical protein
LADLVDEVDGFSCLTPRRQRLRRQPGRESVCARVAGRHELAEPLEGLVDAVHDGAPGVDHLVGVLEQGRGRESVSATLEAVVDVEAAEVGGQGCAQYVLGCQRILTSDLLMYRPTAK